MMILYGWTLFGLKLKVINLISGYIRRQYKVLNQQNTMRCLPWSGNVYNARYQTLQSLELLAKTSACMENQQVKSTTDYSTIPTLRHKYLFRKFLLMFRSLC